MARKRTRGIELPDEVRTRRLGLYASGAAGVHSDQKARAHGVGRTNRVGTRSTRRRLAIAMDMA